MPKISKEYKLCIRSSDASCFVLSLDISKCEEVKYVIKELSYFADSFIAIKIEVLIDITANSINIDGTLKAGYGDRNLTITEDMLKNLVVDPTTGEVNMVNLGGSDKSPYLNTTNNIKVLYKDGKLLVFNTKQEGGSVNLTGSVTGNGSVTYTDGYATVSIDNQTDKQLVINTLENNRMNGSFDKRDTIANVTNQGSLFADTTIKSNGFIEVLGSIKNGLGFKNGDSVSVLNINGQNGIKVDEKLYETGIVVPTIESYGNTNITNANTDSGVVVNGIIQASNGDTTITNDGSQGVTIAGTIDSEVGNVSITNNGTQGVSVTGTIDNDDGNVSITNNGTNGTAISGVINNTVENINITNEAGKLSISGTVENEGKDILVTNNGEGGTDISGNVTNEGDNSIVSITNTNGALNITKTATVKNTSQTADVDNMKITNSGEGLLSIFGKVINKGKGNT